jgi:hypothetical protein
MRLAILIRYYKKYFWIFLLLNSIATHSFSQDVPVPVKIQVPILVKILSFDRNLKTRVGNEIVIGVLFQNKFRTSVNIKDQVLSEFKNQLYDEIEGVALRLVSVNIEDQSDLQKNLSENKVDIIYLTPLRNFDIHIITSIAQNMQILTVTGVPDYNESGISVGFGTKAEKPLILVNLKSAKAEGVDFDSQLLKLAKVIP